MNIEATIRTATVKAFKELYDAEINAADLIINLTKKEFAGEFTVVVFPFLRFTKKGPEQTGDDVGQYLTKNLDEVSGFNVIKGFVNLEVEDQYWVKFLQAASQIEEFGKGATKDNVTVLEYCGPNTNKPLHLGHIRNMLLGWSTAEILSYSGEEVHKVNIYNDRGIAICKSMVAWQKAGNGETPQSTGIKGDHFVGKYYVEYSNLLSKEIAELGLQDIDKKEAERQTSIFQSAQKALRKWEAGDNEVLDLWRRMNGWVYDGFNQTFDRIGVDFEKDYCESDTYLLGKSIVEEGLNSGKYITKDDGSVWVDLTEEGLDEKILLRSDGTSVYLTQDLGTAQLRYDDYKMDRSIYVVANEQDYHFQVLKLTLQKLGKPYGDGIHHMSYGMVELPKGMGRMKSREGTTVDADDLMDEMTKTAEAQSRELGKLDEFTEEQAQQLFEMIGLGALKYFMLRVDPKKKMIFDPTESIDLNGQTGPFIQYAHARIRSVLRRADMEFTEFNPSHALDEQEKDVLLLLHQFPSIVQEAANDLNPSAITSYSYDLAKAYNKFYVDHIILKEEDGEKKKFWLQLSELTGRTLKIAFGLLGIQVPEKM